MRKALFILGQLSDLDVEWMIEAGEKENVAARDVLIHQGEPIENLYLTLSGRFSITDEKIGGKELAQISSGELVGEMSFIDARPPSATVTAIEASSVLVLPRWAIKDKLEEDTGFASRFYYAIALFLSDRLRQTTGRLGYGNVEENDPDELDANVMDNVWLAGNRFERIMKKLSEI